jgi:PPM family protein phosphatase
MDVKLRIESASVSDRGLSDKRPQNEDSFLEMNRCGIFAVADGVGGAQAGDVASQMAVEILGEAFANKREGSDAEEVMREAIERANSAIYQMANELPQLSSMATTLVALYLSGNVATIGHVGDSRLYRVDREGELYRDTDDHSMVADEVRAGRMTQEQAETHPGRNIISRALGAEATVDVDLKTILIDPGTALLLCSDGITRHVSDQEIKGVLTFGGAPAEICDYLKNICYERGAEDNLTAVVIKTRTESGDAEVQRTPVIDEEEVTIATARSAFDEVLEESDQQEVLELDTRELVMPESETTTRSAAATVEIDPFASHAESTEPAVTEDEGLRITSQAPAEVSSVVGDRQIVPLPSFVDSSNERNSGSALGRFASVISLLLIGAFVGLGTYHLFLRPQAQPQNGQPISTMATNNIPLSAFEENRRNVDNDPVAWVGRYSGSAEDCEDYYLLARAYLLMGDFPKARTALMESRDRLSTADPVNGKVLANEIAMGLAVTNDTTIQTNLKKELSDAAAIVAASNANKVK